MNRFRFVQTRDGAPIAVSPARFESRDAARAAMPAGLDDVGSAFEIVEVVELRRVVVAVVDEPVGEPASAPGPEPVASEPEPVKRRSRPAKLAAAPDPEPAPPTCSVCGAVAVPGGLDAAGATKCAPCLDAIPAGQPTLSLTLADPAAELAAQIVATMNDPNNAERVVAAVAAASEQIPVEPGPIDPGPDRSAAPALSTLGPAALADRAKNAATDPARAAAAAELAARADSALTAVVDDFEADPEDRAAAADELARRAAPAPRPPAFVRINPDGVTLVLTDGDNHYWQTYSKPSTAAAQESKARELIAAGASLKPIYALMRAGIKPA